MANIQFIDELQILTKAPGDNFSKHTNTTFVHRPSLPVCTHSWVLPCFLVAEFLADNFTELNAQTRANLLSHLKSNQNRVPPFYRHTTKPSGFNIKNYRNNI